MLVKIVVVDGVFRWTSVSIKFSQFKGCLSFLIKDNTGKYGSYLLRIIGMFIIPGKIIPDLGQY